MLPNTCNFHRTFRFIFSLHLSENAQNVHFREAKFQNFPEEHVPGTPYCTRAFGARNYFCRTSSELLRRVCYYQWVIVSIINNFSAKLALYMTESAFISSYPTSVSGIIILLNTKHLIKNISSFVFFRLEFSAIMRENFPR